MDTSERASQVIPMVDLRARAAQTEDEYQFYLELPNIFA